MSNWNRGDPCTSHWTGVLCFNETLVDGYLHVQELYGSLLLDMFLFHSSQFYMMNFSIYFHELTYLVISIWQAINIIHRFSFSFPEWYYLMQSYHFVFENWKLSFRCYSFLRFVFLVCRQLMNLSLSGNLAPEIGSLVYMERL